MKEQGRSQPRWTRRRLGAVTVVVIAATALGACSSSSSSSSTTAPLKIGMSLPLTGPVADNSKSGYEGYKLWASDVNAAGGQGFSTTFSQSRNGPSLSSRPLPDSRQQRLPVHSQF